MPKNASECVCYWLADINQLLLINCFIILRDNCHWFSHEDSFERDPVFFTVVGTRCSRWNLGGFALGLDFRIETAICELSPEGYMTTLQRHVAVGSQNERVAR